MREIEFRAWDEELKKMYTGDEIEDYSNLNARLSSGGLAIYRIDDGEYIQLKPLEYSGLKDKNDKKIYEGDILRDLDEMPFYVEYSEKTAAFCFVDKFDSYGETKYTTKDLHWEDLELVGNIYENPELLEIENLIK